MIRPTWFAAIAVSGLSAVAGPLNPPVGPVAPTPGPEPRTAVNGVNTPGDDDSIFKITQPGSYYLTANVVGVAGKHGIEIGADSVVLDLNGFAVISSGIGLDGITTADLPKVSVTVRNGVCSAWGQDGVDIRGTNARIENITTRVNLGNGIHVEDGAVITGCIASGNFQRGFQLHDAGSISRCTAFQNSNDGIEANDGCSIEGCTSHDNGDNGILVIKGGAISNSTARLNSGIGIVASTGSTVTNCTANENVGRGFSVDAAVVTGCVSSWNGTQGYFANSSSQLVHCAAVSNVGSNFQIANLVHVLNCESTGAPTTAHIYATGSGNTIDGNRCTGGTVGVLVSTVGERNTIVRNTCSSITTPWNISDKNYYGPIIDLRVPEALATTPAATGFSATSTMGSTNPFSNFTY